MIFMNSMLRGSILFSAETCYNLTENEIRQYEKIEEDFLRKLIAVPEKSCSAVQLYLEFGQHPARFEIFKIRILFLQYILKQKEETLLYRFLEAQMNSPCKGDWITQVISDIKYLELNIEIQDIRKMKKYQLKKILNTKKKKKIISVFG